MRAWHLSCLVITVHYSAICPRHASSGLNPGTCSDHETVLKAKLTSRSFFFNSLNENQLMFHILQRNINPPGTDAGCVVASPSKKDPDYWYQWTRDSAMVFKVVIEYWKRDLNPNGKEETFKLIMDYINESSKMQKMDTPSGGFKTGGLGEVKYHTDGTAYWGR